MLGLFKTLMRPDQEEDPALTIVARAANILQVGEFQLLQLAYFEWHDEELPREECDAVFRLYMLKGEIPAWARHYARKIIQADEAGAVEDGDPAFHRYDHNYVTHVPKGVRHFCIASMCLAFFLVSGLLVGALSGTEATSILPPYFEPGQLESELESQH